MKISILNGNPDPANGEFEAYQTALAGALESAGHTVEHLTLRDMNIRYCVGCFGCWLKDPGRCLARDDSEQVCRSVINSGLTIFTSPVIMGFVSALLKKTNDKMIPLLHPYITLDRGEMHHVARYERYPLTALILEKSPGADDEDLAIIGRVYNRLARNLKTRHAFTRLTSEPIEEVLDEINHL